MALKSWNFGLIKFHVAVHFHKFETSKQCWQTIFSSHLVCLIDIIPDAPPSESRGESAITDLYGKIKTLCQTFGKGAPKISLHLIISA